MAIAVAPATVQAQAQPTPTQRKIVVAKDVIIQEGQRLVVNRP